MITGWTIYWITRLDDLKTASIVFTVISGVACIVTILVSVMALTEADTSLSLKALSFFKKLIMTFIPLVLLTIFIPSSKVAAAMYVVPAIVNNQKVQELPQNLLDLSNAWIKEQTKKLTDTGKEEK